MSIGLIIESRVPRHKVNGVPIATEEVFQTYWQPGCAALHLQWVPLFQSGMPLKQDDIRLVVDELELLKRWWCCTTKAAVPQEVILRVEKLIQALQHLAKDAQVEVYIG